MSRTVGLTPGSLAEYDPPGYLYQGAEINGQMIKYTTLPGTSRVNGSVHGSFISSSTGSGCPHHHKAAGGLDGATNGGVGLHSSSLPGAHLDCERAHRMVNVSLGAAMGVVLAGRDPSIGNSRAAAPRGGNRADVSDTNIVVLI